MSNSDENVVIVSAGHTGTAVMCSYYEVKKYKKIFKKYKEKINTILHIKVWLCELKKNIH